MSNRITTFEKDRENLLKVYLDRGGAYRVPAGALRGVLSLLGYRVQRGWVPEGCISTVDFGRRVICVAEDLKVRLAVRQATRSVSYSTVAEKLGHVRCHSHQPLHLYRPWWHNEARLYAQVFLVPYGELAARDETRVLRAALATQDSLWRAIARLSRHFEVSPTFIRKALETYEVISYDRAQKLIVPRNTMGAKLYPLKVAM